MARAGTDNPLMTARKSSAPHPVTAAPKRPRAAAATTAAPAASAPEGPAGTDLTPSAFDRKAQYQLKRKALLYEAARQFMEGGEGKFSLTEIARKLNITKPALYHYFKSKQEVLFECYALSFDIGDRALAQAIAAGGNGCQTLHAFIRNYTLSGLTELHATMALREMALEPEFSALILQRRDSLHKRLREVVAQGMDDGSIAPCNPTFAVIVLIGAVTELLKVYDPRGEFSAEQIASQTATLLASGLATRTL